MSAWQRYSPTGQQRWDHRRVVHLHRRALFGATWDEIQRDHAGDPQEAIDRVLAAEVRSNGVPAEFERLAELISAAAADQPNVQRLKASIVYRVLYSPDPLRERLALMWHNHFATGNSKVDSLPLMKRQYDTFRRHATAPFGDLLMAMLRDPAMLIWLDAGSNSRRHPNENLGRELMELFTLGIGNYTESDVKNAARALTGLGVKNGRFVFDELQHDSGEKTILGQTRTFDAEQLGRLLMDHPATARRIAGRLIGEFFGEGVVDAAARQQLSTQLVESGLDIGKATETILRSQLFFSDANINSRICDPMSFVIAPLRALEFFHDAPSTLALADWLGKMGLDLLYPPNVAGWPGGRSWLATRTVIARANYAAAVVSGQIQRPIHAPDFTQLATKFAAPDLTSLESMLRTLLLGGAGEHEELTTNKPSAGTDEAKLVLKLLTSASAHFH